MSKGSPVIRLRVKPLMHAAILAFIEHHNAQPLNSHWTMSDFLDCAINFYLKECARKSDYSKGKRKKKGGSEVQG